MAAELFIGVDAGGSQCRARIVTRDGKVLGEALGGPANIRIGKTAWATVLSVCRDAAKAAGLSDGDLGNMHAGMGLAGAISDPDRTKLAARPHPFASLVIDSDAYAAWLGAHEGRDGAVLILGTGSCGFAVIGGVRHVVGGWGWEVSDEASGHAIGREAVRRSLWAHDGLIPMTPLARAILDQFGTPEKIVEWAAKARAVDFARIAPLVFDHAAKNDPLGVAILESAAADAGRIINRLMEIGAKRVSLVGGISERMLSWLSPLVREGLVPPAKDALDGAIMIAHRAAMAGVSPP